MNTERNWGTEPWRQPKIGPDETVLFSEPGRSIDNVCYRSHWLVLVQARFGGHVLYVKHGGGEERFVLGHRTGLQALSAIDTDARYLILWTLMDMAHQHEQSGREMAAHRYQLAFLEGRLKRRKRNGQHHVEVLPQIVEQEASHAND